MCKNFFGFKNLLFQSLLIGIMENLERTFDVKQKAMVNKLFNMQWLKHASNSSNPGKVKIIYKHIQEHDNNNKLEDTDLLTENIKTSYSVEVSDKYRSMNTYKRYLSIDTTPGSDENKIWNKNVNLPNPFPNSKKLINYKDKRENKHMIAKNIVTTKLDTQFYSDKMQKDQSNQNISHNNEDITQNVCSSLSNLQVDQDTQELNLIKHFDGSNNYSKSTQLCMPNVNDKQKSTIGKVTDKNTKGSVETKDKGVQKTIINASKNNIKDEDNISNNDKPFISISNSKRSISYLSKTPTSVNKDIKVDQFNKKNISTRNEIENTIHTYNTYIQHMDDAKTSRNNQITWNNSLPFNTVQKNAINPQQSIQDMCFNPQKITTQARDDIKQMLPWEPNNSKFYNQHFSVNNAMRLSQIPNTFNVPSYGNNVQISNNSDVTSILEATMNRNKENSNVFYKYTPNIQQRFDTSFPDFTGHSILSDQTSRHNPLVQDGSHVDSNNTMRSTNNTHIMNCPLHPIIYAPSPNVQMWNLQSQYPVLPVFNNSPYANYTRNVIPNTINQSNNYNSVGSMHDQQFKYIPRMQMNNYIRGMHSDLSNCTVQARNIVDNIPVKSNQHRKKCPDNSQMIYNPSHVTSHSGSRQDVNFTPTTDTNQCSNPYLWQIQKHNNQNAANYIQMSKYLKSQATQDLVCDDNESNNIRPIISPKEFITINRNLSNKIN